MLNVIRFLMALACWRIFNNLKVCSGQILAILIRSSSGQEARAAANEPRQFDTFRVS